MKNKITKAELVEENNKLRKAVASNLEELEAIKNSLRAAQKEIGRLVILAYPQPVEPTQPPLKWWEKLLTCWCR